MFIIKIKKSFYNFNFCLKRVSLKYPYIINILERYKTKYKVNIKHDKKNDCKNCLQIKV